MFKKLLNSLYFVLGAFLLISACTEEDDFADETFSSDQFSILKVTAIEGNEETRLESGIEGISAYQLQLNVVFSHEVNTDAINNGLSISGGPDFDISYDSTNSVATIEFALLDYQSEYSLSLPLGSYGASGETLENEFSLNFTTKPFVTPNVSLSTSNANPEEGGSTVVTATLSEITTADVSVNIEVTGEASSGEDFTLGATTIVVPVGELSASVSLDIIDDEIAEGAENIQVSIVSVENGVDNTTEPLNFSIVDNDVFTDLTLKGVMAIRWATETDNNSGKAVHLRAIADIADLSVYGIGVANNGGGSDSIEYRFPEMSVAAGEDVLLARDDAALLNYFGDGAAEFEHVISTDAMTQNGDDAIELYSGTAVIDTYGDVNIDGTDMSWEYSGSWAYKLGGEWRTGGVDCASGSTISKNSACIYPLIASDLLFKGAMEIETSPETSDLRIRAYHFEALEDIDDLSDWAVEIYNNGTGAPPFRIVGLPSESAAEGDDILVVRDSDFEAGNVGAYFGTCDDGFTIYTSGDVTSNGDDALVFTENAIPLDTLGVVGVDGTGESWEYADGFGYRTVPGAEFEFSGAGCTTNANTNSDASCCYPFCE